MVSSRNMNPILFGAVVIGVSSAVCPECLAGEAGPVRAFRELCAAKAKEVPEGRMTARGRDGWLFFRGELRHVSVGRFWGEIAPKVSKAHKPKNADPLPAILDFKRQLDELGVELILVPVPPKAAVYPDKLSDRIKLHESGAPPRLDAALQEFYGLLAQKGVDVVDLFPLLAAGRGDPKGAMYCRQDTHYSGLACALIARHLAEKLKARDWYGNVPKTRLVGREKEVEIAGDLWKDLKDEAVPKEKLSLRFVGTDAGGGGPLPVEPDRKSPVLLIGDSHTLVFHAGAAMHGVGAGLPDQLALELGFAVDLLGMMGSGATPSRIRLYRRGKGEPDYIQAKKAVVWCFSAREFTESTGWAVVPVTRKTWKKN